MNNYISMILFFITLVVTVGGLFYLIFWLVMEAEELINEGRNKLFPGDEEI